MPHWGGGQGHWWQRPQRILISVSSPRGHHFDIKAWPYPTAYRLQCWNASCQTTSRVGIQPHPSTDRVPEAILSSQPLLNTILDTALSTRGTTHSPTNQWAGTIPFHQEACTSHRTNLTHQRADTRSKRSYNPPARRKETTNTESSTK